MESPYPVGQEFVLQRMTSAGKLSLGSATLTGGSFVISLRNLWDCVEVLSKGGYIPKGSKEAVFIHEFGVVIHEEMMHCLLLRDGIPLRFHHRLHALLDEFSEIAEEARSDKPVILKAEKGGAKPDILVLSEPRPSTEGH